jgi:hypothetical protein
VNHLAFKGAIKMKIHTINKFLILGLFLSSTTHAADSNHKKELNAKSTSVGLSAKNMQLLEVDDGPGMSAVLGDVLDTGFGSLRMDDRDIGEFEIEDEYTTVTGNGWNLTIWEDGTKAEMMNFANYERKKKEIKDKYNKYRNKKIEQDRLETLGMKFIRTELSKHIKLAKNEQIVPLHTMYEIDGDGDLNGNVHEETVGNIVVFSRVVDGIDVVGAGSKISILFANDETPVGFRYDWPTYRKSGLYQKVVNFETAKERLSSLSGLKKKAKKIERTRLECGYYDPGVVSRDKDAFIQSACYAFYKGKAEETDNTEVVGYADVIPMGQQVEIDNNWNEVKKHYSKGEQCEETDVTSVTLN